MQQRDKLECPSMADAALWIWVQREGSEREGGSERGREGGREDSS